MTWKQQAAERVVRALNRADEIGGEVRDYLQERVATDPRYVAVRRRLAGLLGKQFVSHDETVKKAVKVAEHKATVAAKVVVANAAIAPLHDRMPVIIAPSHFGWWLKDDDPRSESHKMALDRAPDDPLKIYPVSDLVNSPKTDDPRCIEPVRIDRDMFERQWWGDT